MSPELRATVSLDLVVGCQSRTRLLMPPFQCLELRADSHADLGPMVSCRGDLTPLHIAQIRSTLNCPSSERNTILPTDPEAKNWRENATAILVRESTISADDIFQAKRLKAIGKQGVGINLIDQDACAQRNIPIFNTPGANAQSVAELVLALTMAVARQLRSIVVNQAAGIEVRKENYSVQ
ncbi:hypothetical protein BDW59DRAFT_67464 [Aspergillus cavernicola]|uniref:D-isomer specific 2-hydroxyacid dehydrogenase catalytic domain-containing protein n=1 Tax=Aspergillus cavernicola TaxID=176166 RepID=A0ABR4IEC1_9EURO